MHHKHSHALRCRILPCLLLALAFCFTTLARTSAAQQVEPTPLPRTTDAVQARDARAPVPIYSGLQVNMSADAAVVLETSRQTILYEREADRRSALPAAARLMTALLAAERLKTDTVITVSSEAAEADLELPGPDTEKPRTGDKYPLNFLLLKILNTESNTAAIALAEHMGNTESKFVDMMNQRAAALKMGNTMFANSTGRTVIDTETLAKDSVTNPERALLQYSTPGDLIKLAAAVWQNRTLANLLQEPSHYLVLDASQVISFHSPLASLWPFSDGRISGAYAATMENSSVTISFGQTDEMNLITLVMKEGLILLIDSTLELYRAMEEHYQVSPLVNANAPFSGQQEHTDQGDAFGLVFPKTVTYIHPVNDAFLESSVLYRSNGPFRLPISTDLIAGQVIFTLKDKSTIAVDVIPDRQILSDNSFVSFFLTQMQNNNNIALILFLSLILLMLSMAVVSGRNIVAIIRLLRLYLAERKSRPG